MSSRQVIHLAVLATVLLTTTTTTDVAHGAITSYQIYGSRLTCEKPWKPTTFPTCLTVRMSQLTCSPGAPSASVPLPRCVGVSRTNVDSLSSLLCPRDGSTVDLPSCIKVTADNLLSASLSPSDIAPGTLSANVIVSNENIQDNSVPPTDLAAGTLPASVSVTDASILSMSSSRFASGSTIPSSVTVSNNNFAVNSISTDKLTPGPLGAQVQVTNNNFVSATISSSKFAAGNLNSGVTVSSSNVASSSLAADRLSCSGVSPVDLSCIQASVSNMVCDAGTTPFPSCVSMQGSAIVGDLQGTQFFGNLTNAVMSPTGVKCTSNDNAQPNGVALPNCVTVDPTTQLLCSTSTPKNLTCLAVDGGQITDALTNRVTVPASNILGLVNDPSVSVDGGKLVDESLSATQLYRVDVPSITSPSLALSMARLTPQDVQLCCPTGIPTACNLPTFKLANIALGYIFFNTTSSAPNKGIDVVMNGTQGCCQYYGVYHDYSGSTPILFTAVCLPDY